MMTRIGHDGFFSGAGTVPMAGAAPRTAPRLAQMPRPQPMSPRVENARRMRDEAVKNLRGVEDNIAALDLAMGPEATLQALEEGRQSVERAQQEYDRVLAEESA
jgi:hypothetical protein